MNIVIEVFEIAINTCYQWQEQSFKLILGRKEHSKWNVSVQMERTGVNVNWKLITVIDFKVDYSLHVILH